MSNNNSADLNVAAATGGKEPQSVRESVKKRNGRTRWRLTRMVLLAVVLFVGLALAEDNVEKYLRAREKRDQGVRVREEITLLVKKYNRTLVLAYDSNNPTAMTKLVTPDELRRIDTYIVYNHYERVQALKTDLLDIQIKSVKLAKKNKRAKVRTSEKWTYWYVDRKTKKLVNPRKHVQYTVTYGVEKNGGRWRVGKVTVDSDKAVKP